MRALLVVIHVATALWSGYWFVGSRALERGVVAWFDAPSAQGLQTSHQGVAVQGFPNRFDLTVTEPRLADPARGLSWTAPFVQVFAMTWKPWHLIAALPESQTVALPDQTVAVTSSQLRGSVVVDPDTNLTLDRLTLEGDNLRLSSDRGWAGAAARLLVATRRDAADAATHEVFAEATSITPDQNFRMEMKSVSALPELIDRVRIDAKAGFSAPIDRFAGQTRPVLQRLDLREASVTWGAFSLSAKGGVQPDPQGLAEGRIDIRVAPWRDLVPVLVAAGLVTPEVAPTVTRAMELLAQQGPDPEVLEVPLVLAGGRMALGPIPLGPAPRLD